MRFTLRHFFFSLWRSPVPPMNCFCTLVKSHLSIFIYRPISGFSVLFLWSMCLSLHQYRSLHYLISHLEDGRLPLPSICSSFSKLFSLFHINFIMILAVSTIILAGIVVIIGLNPYINLGRKWPLFSDKFSNPWTQHISTLI